MLTKLATAALVATVATTAFAAPASASERVVVAPPRPGVYEVDVRVVQAIDGEKGVVGPDRLALPMRVK